MEGTSATINHRAGCGPVFEPMLLCTTKNITKRALNEARKEHVVIEEGRCHGHFIDLAYT